MWLATVGLMQSAVYAMLGQQQNLVKGYLNVKNSQFQPRTESFVSSLDFHHKQTALILQCVMHSSSCKTALVLFGLLLGAEAPVMTPTTQQRIPLFAFSAVNACL